MRDAIAILATGPSLNKSDIDYLRGKCRVMAVNDAYRLCSWADYLYAADERWWVAHDYCKDFMGERWTQHQGSKVWATVAKHNGLSVIPSINSRVVNTGSFEISRGYNSGFQALNLSILFGYKKILLLGFDCRIVDGKRHFFGDHQGKLKRNSPYHLFKLAFESSAAKITSEGVEVVNCTPGSAITCFKQSIITQCL